MRREKRTIRGELVPVTRKIRDVLGERPAPPAIVTETGKAAAFAYAEFFGAEIESAHTYRAYRAAGAGVLPGNPFAFGLLLPSARLRRDTERKR